MEKTAHWDHDIFALNARPLSHGFTVGSSRYLQRDKIPFEFEDGAMQDDLSKIEINGIGDNFDIFLQPTQEAQKSPDTKNLLLYPNIARWISRSRKRT